MLARNVKKTTKKRQFHSGASVVDVRVGNMTGKEGGRLVLQQKASCLPLNCATFIRRNVSLSAPSPLLCDDDDWAAARLALPGLILLVPRR